MRTEFIYDVLYRGNCSKTFGIFNKEKDKLIVTSILSKRDCFYNNPQDIEEGFKFMKEQKEATILYLKTENNLMFYTFRKGVGAYSISNGVVERLYDILKQYGFTYY